MRWHGRVFVAVVLSGALGCKGSGPSCGEGTHEENGKCVVGSAPPKPTGKHAVERPSSAEALRAKLVELFQKGDQAAVRALVFTDDELAHACADPVQQCKAQLKDMMAKQPDAPKMDDAQLEAAAQPCAKQVNQLLTDTRDPKTLTDLGDREKRPADGSGRAEQVKEETDLFEQCFKVDWSGANPQDQVGTRPLPGCTASMVGGVSLMSKDDGDYLKIEVALEIDGQYGLLTLPECIPQI